MVIGDEDLQANPLLVQIANAVYLPTFGFGLKKRWQH